MVTSFSIQPKATPPALSTVSTCGVCNATFPSRNALFRHIKTDCTHHPDREVISTKKQRQRQSLIVFFGYRDSPATAGDTVRSAIEAAVGGGPMMILSSTQASTAKSRRPILGQDTECPSAMDMLVVAFLGYDDLDTSEIAEKMEEHLTSLTDSTDMGIRLHGLLHATHEGLQIHAEQSCTQHVYQYILPLTWIPQSNEIAAWYQNDMREAAPTSLRRLKEILREAESARVQEQTNPRYGALAHKQRRPWHNYADPALQGEASPNNDPVWRIVDRSRLVGFIQQQQDDDDDAAASIPYLVCEFSGDEFLSQQVRRIMGTTVAMVNGWLPHDFMKISIDRSRVIETPLAPAGYLYRSHSRYHFSELYFKGKQLFDHPTVHKMTDDPTSWMQQELLKDANDSTSREWRDELCTTVAPRICKALDDDSEVVSESLCRTSQAPPEYERVLSMLRELIAKDLWPTTSSGRSSVIQDLPKQAGSFTVTSPTSFNFTNISIPKATTMFPDLAAAVFDLEKTLAPDRLPSSHCAINANAQFTPHVDSGRGLGQSLSMIVGLGDFSGGDLVVEGDAHDIRYTPLQFDGWKLRHWTRNFAGERFSLVWFTPEGIAKNAV